MQLFIVEYEEIGVSGVIYTHKCRADTADDAETLAINALGDDIRVLSVISAYNRKLDEMEKIVNNV